MAQLSRPFQIVLGAVLLLGLIGVIALRAHSSNPSEPAPTSVPAPNAVAAKPASGTTARPKASDPAAQAHKAISHKAAPRSQKTVVLAHETPTSAHKTTVTVTKTPTHTHTTAVTISKTPTHTTTVILHRTAAASHKTAVGSGGGANSQASKHAPQQAVVEHELAQNKTVLLVFWNPKASVDREVQAQARALASGSKGTVVVHSALANQIGQFGSITEVVHVYQTPAILIVNRHGVVSTLTGLTDVFALRQAVSEAQHATH